MAEFYEVRIYRVFDVEKQTELETWIRDALLPALGRQGVKNVGVFRNRDDPNDHSQFMVIPFQGLEQFANLNPKLAADKKFAQASEEWFGQDMEDPVYARVDSWITQAFDGMPKMELPSFLDAPDRLYELRLYESHNIDAARRKVKMFNDGETQLMRDSNLSPVFFGRTLAGPDSPNLIYLTGAESEEAHNAHWKTFVASDGWAALKPLPEYANTVSKIHKWRLKPTDFSQL